MLILDLHKKKQYTICKYNENKDLQKCVNFATLGYSPSFSNKISIFSITFLSC